MCLISLYYIPPGVGQYIGIIIYRDNSSVTIIDIKKIFQYRNIACTRAVNRNQITEQLTGYLQIPVNRF